MLDIDQREDHTANKMRDRTENYKMEMLIQKARDRVEQGLIKLKKYYPKFVERIPNMYSVHCPMDDIGIFIIKKINGRFVITTFLKPGSHYSTDSSMEELLNRAVKSKR